MKNSPLISSIKVIDPPFKAWHFIIYFKKENEANMLRKPSPSKFNSNAVIEQGFKLPLPMIVEGQDALGRAFKEKTTLSYISHQGASFSLKNSITLGSKLKLIIGLPPKLAEDKNLKLAIRGKVVFVEIANNSDSEQRVSIRFENKYIIKPDE